MIKMERIKVPGIQSQENSKARLSRNASHVYKKSNSGPDPMEQFPRVSVIDNVIIQRISQATALIETL